MVQDKIDFSNGAVIVAILVLYITLYFIAYHYLDKWRTKHLTKDIMSALEDFNNEQKTGKSDRTNSDTYPDW